MENQKPLTGSQIITNRIVELKNAMAGLDKDSRLYRSLKEALILNTQILYSKNKTKQ